MEGEGPCWVFVEGENGQDLTRFDGTGNNMVQTMTVVAERLNFSTNATLPACSLRSPPAAALEQGTPGVLQGDASFLRREL
jgi:hypothetical protein